MTNVVVALGGNLLDPMVTLQRAIEKLKGLGSKFRVSKFYRTIPVSSIVQPEFLNAVCSFSTKLSPVALFQELEAIERELGKVKKEKDAPRIIDLDLLFFGSTHYEDGNLQIPHPRWKERLFVLLPLFDLFKEVEVDGEKWDIKSLIEGIS